jgi:hypothetical protein
MAADEAREALMPIFDAWLQMGYAAHDIEHIMLSTVIRLGDSPTVEVNSMEHLAVSCYAPGLRECRPEGTTRYVLRKSPSSNEYWDELMSRWDSWISATVYTGHDGEKPCIQLRSIHSNNVKAALWKTDRMPVVTCGHHTRHRHCHKCDAEMSVNQTHCRNGHDADPPAEARG